jgi:hypothetical protein
VPALEGDFHLDPPSALIASGEPSYPVRGLRV